MSDTFPTQHSTTSPRGGPWQSHSPRLSAAFRAVQLESGEGWLSGERHTGPSLGSRSVALCTAAGRETDCEPWLSTSAPETVPSARGPGGASLLSQTSCRAPDVDLSGPCRGGEHGQDTVRADERWDICLTRLSHVLSVGCDHTEV